MFPFTPSERSQFRFSRLNIAPKEKLVDSFFCSLHTYFRITFILTVARISISAIKTVGEKLRQPRKEKMTKAISKTKPVKRNEKSRWRKMKRTRECTVERVRVKKLSEPRTSGCTCETCSLCHWM